MLKCSKKPALNTAAAKRGFICVQEERTGGKKEEFTPKKKKKREVYKDISTIPSKVLRKGEVKSKANGRK